MTERLLNQSEKGYKMLEFVAKALELESPKGLHYYVSDTYLDYGQDWMWTTICRQDNDLWSIQVLNPKEWKDIMEATSTFELMDIVNEIRSGKYFGDK